MSATTQKSLVRLLPGTAERAALFALLLLPLLLMHAHGIAEVAVGVIDAAFLIHCLLARDWAWLGRPWLRIGLAWWAWVVFCSLPLPIGNLDAGGLNGLVQAFATLRFLLLLSAMEWWVLRDPAPRRWLGWLISASAFYIALQSSVQFFTGYNLYDVHYGLDRVLTGPFAKPRAGPPLAHVMLPTIIPPMVSLLNRRRIIATAGALGIAVAAVCLMVLVGQRMPLLLLGLGMLIAASLIRRLRPPVLVAGLAGVLLLAASPLIAPAEYARLVVLFSQQMTHFATSHYGLLYTRAWEIGVQNGLTGLGGDGFHYGCQMPRYFRPSFDGSMPDGGGAHYCWHHPHNFYAEALVNGGFIGLFLFCGLVIVWLWTLASGLRRNPDALRVALFATVAAQLWPFASTNGFISMPMGGWLFLLLGWGLAEARWRAPANPEGPAPAQQWGWPRAHRGQAE